MKLLIAILFALGSLPAFSEADVSSYASVSAGNFEYFHGSGVYKTPSGRSGNFLASLTVRKLDEHTYNFIYGIYYARKNYHFEFHIKGHDDGRSYFDITEPRGGVIGYGYCIGAKCHFEYDLDGHHMEDTIYRKARKNSIMCMGSKSGDDGIVKSWKMHLKKIF